MLNEKILTVAEVSQHLRVPEDIVKTEISSGRLKALNIGGHVRIPESQLNAYKSEACGSSNTHTFTQTPGVDGLRLKPGKDFAYTWPDQKHELFSEVQEGVGAYKGKEYHIRLGFTVRDAAGAPRRRCLILVDRYATVEFVAEGKRGGGKLASIIKDRNNKQLPLGGTVPPEYAGLPIGPYRDVVKGAGASNGLAVICDCDDFPTMVKHALIRYKFREDRQ